MDTLIQSIEQELADIRHKGRVHGRRSTYTQGCRGPLCRKANRDYGRSRLDSTTPRGWYAASAVDAILAEYIAKAAEQPAISA